MSAAEALNEKTPLMSKPKTSSEVAAEKSDDDLEQQVRRSMSTVRRRSSFIENVAEVKTAIEWWMFVVLIISGSQAAVGVPHMAFGLFSSNLRDKTGLSESDTTNILNCGMVGGMVICFVPGMLFDAYGYKAMVMIGGVFSIAGALTWFFYLSQGGAAVLPLAIGYFLQSFGARCHYLAGQVASMNVFPAEVAGSVSATIAICVSLGYILLPMAWKTLFQNADAPNARPVAEFHGFLAVIFLVNTFAGLCVSPLLSTPAPPAGKAGARARPSITSKLLKLASRDGMVMFAFITFSLSFLMVYISSGCAAVGKDALGDVSASVRDSQVASVMGNVGTFGMAGRFVLGFGADFLQFVPAVGKAARWICLMVACAMTAVVYIVYITQYVSKGTADPHVWSIASSVLAFAYGGFFSIFPATVRVLFNPADVGFFYGGLTSYTGVLNVVYSMIFVKLHWSTVVWRLLTVGSVLDFIALVLTAWRSWGVEP